MRRILSFILIVSMCLSSIPASYAMLNENDYRAGTKVEYTATNEESYTITVPAKLSPGQSGTVKLEGSWPQNRVITVTADKTVTLINSINTSDTKTLDVYFDGIAEQGDNTRAQTFTQSVSVQTIKNALFGTWNGRFNYNVATSNVAVKSEIPVQATDKDGNDLNAKSYVIDGNEKDQLLSELQNSDLIENAEDVDALIEIKSDDFEDVADTTFDVSSIAQPGDQVVILHYNEETREWEYISQETVDGEGKVNANFSSYSPVAFVVVQQNGTMVPIIPTGTNQYGFYFNALYVNKEANMGYVFYEDGSSECYLTEDSVASNVWFCPDLDYTAPAGTIDYATVINQNIFVTNDGKTLTLISDGEQIVVNLESESTQGVYFNNEYVLSIDSEENIEMGILLSDSGTATISEYQNGELVSKDSIDNAFSTAAHDHLIIETTSNSVIAFVSSDGRYLFMDGLWEVRSVHNYKSQVLKEKNCTEDGEIVYTCEDCGDTYSTVIAASHTYTTTINFAPTCTENGEALHTCSVCGYSETSTLNATGHSYENSVCKVCGEYYYYSFYITSSNRTKIGFTETTTDLNIPEKFYDAADGRWYRVTGISDSAFKNCTNLVTVTIPDSVGYLGFNVFEECSNLRSINIPAGITQIPWYAFKNCSSLQSIILPDNVTTIGIYAFANCSSLQSVNIPAEVTEIPWNAFDSCTNLSELTFAEDSKLEEIAMFAFHKCTSLTSVKLPQSLKVLGNAAFYHCSSLEQIELNNGLEVIDEWALANCAKLSEITIPDTVKTIGAYAFYWDYGLSDIVIPHGVTNIEHQTFEKCHNLQNISLPDTLTTIGDQAFAECTSLTTITIPCGVTSLGKAIFKSCSSLQNVIIDDANITYCAVDGVIYSKDMKKLVYYPNKQDVTSFAVPDGVETICAYSFQDSTLTDIVLSDSVIEIEEGAFYNCESLINLTMSNNIEKIDDKAFYACRKLNSILFPNTLKEIGEEVFRHDNELTSIHIPASVTTIGVETFTGLKGLTQITVDAANQKYCSVDGVLYSKDMKTLICYPAGKTNISFIVPDGVETLGVEAFYYSESLQTIHLPESLCVIDDYVFWHCKNLLNITIPANVTSIGVIAFNGCSALTDIVFANTTGWYATKTKDAVDGDVQDVTDSAVNATTLKLSYGYGDYYYWYRNNTK